MEMTKESMVLSGDDNVPAMPLKDSEVNHLRLMLAWMRVEYMLDENMQSGYVQGLNLCVEHGLTTPEVASEMLEAKADEIKQCPAYVQQAVKMLTKALAKHDKQSKIIDMVDL